MGIQFSGVLRDPSGALAANVPLKFTSTINIGDLLISVPVVFTTDQFGQYDFNLELGRYHFEVRFESAFYTLGIVDVHTGLPNPSTVSLLVPDTNPIEPGAISYAESLLAKIQQEGGKVSVDKAQIDLWRNDIDAWHQDITSKHYDIQLWHSDVLTKAFEVSQDHEDVEGWHSDINLWHGDVEQWKNEVQEDRDYIDNLVKNPDNQFPVPPVFIDVSVYDTFVSLAPDTSELSWVGEFEFYLRGTDPNGQRIFKGRARYMEIIGLFPDTTYYFSVRSVNSLGVSEYVETQGTTTNIGLDVKEQLGLPPDSNLGDILDQFNRELHTYEDTLGNYSVTIENVGRSQADLTASVDDSMGRFASRQAEYEWRLANSLSLIDALITVDPATGQIINKAFQYTNESYTEAGIRIDGMNALINLHTEDISLVGNTLTDHQATLKLHQSQINLKTSFTQVEGLIAGALSALEPAYSWQFNTGVDGWANTSWNTAGYITTTGTTNITGISFNASENPIIRFMVRTADRDTAFLDLSWNGGNQHVYIPVAYINGTWIASTRELTAADGWAGTITSIQLGGSVLDIDFIVVSKRSASEQQLDSLIVRVATAEETLDAENARWGVYVTTDYWDTHALTSTDVKQEINGWDSTWGITAKLQVLDEEGTIQKANNAKLWIDGADATIDARVNSWWVNGEESNLRSAELSIDALKGEIRNTVSSVSGLEKNLNNVSYESFRLAYGDLLNANGTAKQGIAIAYAQEKLIVLTKGQQATATKLLELDAVNETSIARFNSIDQAFVDVNEAVVTQGSELQAKVGEVEANAEKYTRTAVSFWVNGAGEPVDAPADPNNPPAGWQKLDGPLAEDIRKLSITTGNGATASIGQIAQVFEDKDGKLVARGGLLVDNNGRITGFTAYDNGETSNLDLIGENVRIGYANANEDFVPLLNFNTTDKLLDIRARLILSDGHSVNGLNDIKGTDGDTIFKVYQHSVDGVTNWHSDMALADRFQRNATVTNGVQGAWSVAYQIVGYDGSDGSNGIDGIDGLDGSFHSYIFYTSPTKPATPTGGTYNGTTETYPTGWQDDPLYTEGQITWVSHRKYSDNGTSWVGTAWSAPSIFTQKGDTIFVEYQYSSNNTSWHDDLLVNDKYERRRTNTNGVAGPWSSGIQIRGDNGTDGYTPQKGVDYFDGTDGPFNSFVYITNATQPVAPTGGSYNGTTEVVPTSWLDNPVFTTGLITWVSQTKYLKNASGVWVNSGWSTPSVFVKQGDKGEAGSNGTNGYNNIIVQLYKRSATIPSGPTSSSTYNFTTNTLTGFNNGWSTTIPVGTNPVYITAATASSTGLTDIISANEWSAPVVLVENGADGVDGTDGVPGPKGADGVTTYTWIRYADSVTGSGISNSPTGKAYIGFAYNKVSSVESNVAGDYVWSLIKGDKGDTGIGVKGADGVTTYTWIKYSDNPDGTGLYDLPTNNTKYIGIAVNKTIQAESSLKTDYVWSQFKGDVGPQGVPGANGVTAYTWVKYADSSTGSGINNSPTNKSYIGFAYNKLSDVESDLPSDYIWSLIKGDVGDQGVPGVKGADGVTTYTWIKYSNNSDGTGLYDIPVESTAYIGIAVNKTVEAESSNKTDYVWSRFKGDTGTAGVPGTNGITTYTWIKYADTVTGTGISNDPSGKEYIGFAYNKTTVTESSTASDYTWSLIKGDKGNTGVDGAPGVDGQTTYTWIKYANVADGTGLYDTPTSSTKYIGIAVNKTTATESAINTDYTWSQFKGEDGAAGLNNATVYLYQRAASTPSNPSANVTYTFATKAISGQNNGWLVAVPAGTYPLYVTVATASSASASDVIAPAEWAAPTILAQNGATGATGATGSAGAPGLNSATVFLYQRATSTPANPSTTSTYTFATGVLTGQGALWTQSVPSGTNPLYVTTATAASTASTDTIASTEWAIPNILAQNGIDGPQGVPGLNGTNGVTTYTWIKYADSATGIGLSNDPTGKAYIGFAYNKTTATESNTAGDYTWSLVKGEQGNQGVPGVKGADGVTLYTWIKYSDNSDGTGLYDTPTAATKYIGIAVNKTVQAESSVKTDYVWSQFKGDQGPQGVPGAAGSNGVTTYTWIKYADSAAGSGISNSPTGKLYIGFAYNKTTATESNSPSDYAWSLIKGDKGDTGVGTPGADGVTTYTWVKYSDVADGTGLYDTPTASTLYIGIATNKTVATESAVKTDYIWSKFRGEDGFNSATIFLYKRSISAPTKPTSVGTYTFETNLITGINNGWLQAVPAGIDPIYVISATAVSTSATDTIQASEWSTAVILAQNGNNGTNGTNGVNGTNGSGWYSLGLRNGVFPSDGLASGDFYNYFGRNPVTDDHLTYYNSNQTVTSVKRFNGTTWAAPLQIIHGDLLVKETITGDRIVANAELKAPVLKGGKIELVGNAFMKISSGVPFAADNFIEWVGPTSLDLNGNPIMADIRKNNAISYLTSNGDAYFGGSLSAGVLKTGVTNTDKTPYAANSYPVTIGPFGSNGKAKTVVVSFALSAYSQNPTNPNNPTQPKLSWQLQRKIGSGSWATVSSGVFNGTTSADFEAEPPAHWLVRETCWGSFTFTDNTNSTSDFNYRVLVISYSRYHATSNVNTHNLSLISTEQ